MTDKCEGDNEKCACATCQTMKLVCTLHPFEGDADNIEIFGALKTLGVCAATLLVELTPSERADWFSSVVQTVAIIKGNEAAPAQRQIDS
jgi:hypothetical protein